MVRRRGKKWHLKLSLYDVEVGAPTPARTKKEAETIGEAIKRAVRIGDAHHLDPVERDVCLRIFENRGWDTLPGLVVEAVKPHKKLQELVLVDAIKMTLSDPEVRKNPNRERHVYAFAHIRDFFHDDCRVDEIWIPEIKKYIAFRQSEGAKGSTIGKEKAALSLMFKILIQHRVVSDNPASMVNAPSDEDGEREVYISKADFMEIVAKLPRWEQPIVLTLFYTGMRRGEALGMKIGNIDWDARIIRLTRDQTKEGKAKRVPICLAVIPILRQAVGDRQDPEGMVFLIDGERPPSEDSLRKPWVNAVREKGLVPGPTVHDIRHVWKINALESGMDEEIRRAIMGHTSRKHQNAKRGDVHARYGQASDEHLVRVIDAMTFDHGKTKILVARTTRIDGQKKQGQKRDKKSQIYIGSLSALA
ncbi:MAG TPA: tyrosine-type recombinase/integrase [Desulfomonilaceae bacterium]|nr:tyrosine-type recombinase/integrase [Desulfomonilaceae bacterium]